MQRKIDLEMRELKTQILTMGGYVEKAIEQSLKALVERSEEGFLLVHEYEKKINQAHIQIDENCLRLLARQSPLATDLRLVLAVIKINTDLERMGDQAVNIAHNGKHYLKVPPVKELIDIPKMGEIVKKMVRDSLDALLTNDYQKCEEVLRTDDSVDILKDKIFLDVSDLMKKNPSVVDGALNLILIARNLERLGDHATNIAEDVIFVATGSDIRHNMPKPQKT